MLGSLPVFIINVRFLQPHVHGCCDLFIHICVVSALFLPTTLRSCYSIRHTVTYLLPRTLVKGKLHFYHCERTSRTETMVFNKKRDCNVNRKLEAKLDVHSFTRQKFCPISCRRYMVGTENKDHTIPRVLRRQRKHTGGKPDHQGAKCEYIRTIARTDCELLPNHLSQYHSENYYIY